MKRGALRGRVYRVFLLAACFAACAPSACAPPVGSISGILPDIFWAVSDHVTYKVNDPFERSHVQAFASYGDDVKPISATICPPTILSKWRTPKGEAAPL
jgi:hypothetical protein